MKQSYEKYLTAFGTRFTLHQKTRFINEVVKDMKELDYESTLINGKSGFTKVRNLLFGNLKHAKVIICVPYDTPQKYFWINPKYYPLNGNRSNIKELFPVYGPAIAIYLLMFIGIQFTPSSSENLQLQTLFVALMFLMIGFLVFYLFRGFANRKNYNRNSVSIIAALQLAEQLDKDTRKKVAFLFTDKNKHKHAGAIVAVEDFMKQNRNPNIICLNCIATGDVMAIGYNPSTKKLAQELNRANKTKWKQVELNDNKRFQSMMEHFQKAVMISSGYIDAKGDLCVDHTGTGKDNRFDESHLQQVVDALETYIKAL